MTEKDTGETGPACPLVPVSQAEKRNGWMSKEMLTLIARVCSILGAVISLFGTLIASMAVWIFLQAWGDIRAQGSEMATLGKQIVKIEAVLAERDRNDIARDFRLGRIEAKIFQ